MWCDSGRAVRRNDVTSAASRAHRAEQRGMLALQLAVSALADAFSAGLHVHWRRGGAATVVGTGKGAGV